LLLQRQTILKQCVDAAFLQIKHLANGLFSLDKILQLFMNELLQNYQAELSNNNNNSNNNS